MNGQGSRATIAFEIYGKMAKATAKLRTFLENICVQLLHYISILRISALVLKILHFEKILGKFRTAKPSSRGEKYNFIWSTFPKAMQPR